MPKFSIDVRFGGGLTPSQQKVFSKAAQRWQQVITGDFPTFTQRGETFTSLVIQADAIEMDKGGTEKDGNKLGHARPTVLRPDGLPAKGEMSFDSFDLGAMEAEGTFESVILHEMGHVLGIGTLWRLKAIILNSGSLNPTFAGKRAREEFAKLAKLSGSALPIENTGGPGTAEGHWRETVLGDELMTGLFSGRKQPMSRVTVASLADMGYKVNIGKADSFKLPTPTQLSLMGVGAAESRKRRCSCYNQQDAYKEPKRAAAVSAGKA